MRARIAGSCLIAAVIMFGSGTSLADTAGASGADRASADTTGASEHRHTPPAAATLDSTVVEVPMDLATGRPIVLVALNGHGPYRFILDTGAGGTIVDATLAQRLALPIVGRDSLGDPAHPSTMQAVVVRARSITLGGVKLEGVNMTAFDLRRMIGPGYGGVLGLPDLQAFLLTLDFPQGRIRITLGEMKGIDSTLVQYQSPDGIISIPVQFNGSTFSAHLDSGSSGGFMFPRTRSDELSFKSDPVEIGKAGTVSNTATVWLAQLDGEIRFAGLSFPDPEVRLSDLHGSSANIGFDVLRDLTMTIDQRNHRLRLERTGTPESQPHPPRRLTGVILAGMRPGAAGPATTKGGLKIEGIVPGSPADQAGLIAGDVILSINGRAARTLSPEEIAQIFQGSQRLNLIVRREGNKITVSIE
jgi:hypothetical protein